MILPARAFVAGSSSSQSQPEMPIVEIFRFLRPSFISVLSRPDLGRGGGDAEWPLYPCPCFSFGLKQVVPFAVLKPTKCDQLTTAFYSETAGSPGEGFPERMGGDSGRGRLQSQVQAEQAQGGLHSHAGSRHRGCPQRVCCELVRADSPSHATIMRAKTIVSHFYFAHKMMKGKAKHLMSCLLLGQVVGTMDPALGSATPGTSTANMSSLSHARGTVLGLKLDKMSDSVTGQTAVNPKG